MNRGEGGAEGREDGAVRAWGFSGERVPVILTCLFLFAVTWAVYARVLECGFLNYDDNYYVTENLRVRSGLTLENVRWAFTTAEVANWHPLTWLSHMLDVELFGLDARAHHGMNLLFHACNAVLLFLVLRSATGSHGRSATVALLFAIHPLHVESVAWVSERKDVLSTLFWLLATAAYLAYARKPSVRLYLAVAAAFALGLMAKPMLVTLPLTLLLMDYWPLRRLREPGEPGGGAPWRLLAEKAPLLALSLISSLVTLYVQKIGGAVSPLDSLPLSYRVGNAIVSYVRYLWMTAWPKGLAVYYQYPSEPWPAGVVFPAACLLLAASFGALMARRTRPYLAFGWFWYLITLLPVIGLVQVGVQALADRYTYVPLTGIFVAGVWSASDLFDRWKVVRPWRLAAATAILLPLALAARAQTGWWKDDIALFGHALRATGKNYVANMNLGVALSNAGRDAEALDHHLAAIRHNPHSAELYNNLGLSLSKLGRLEEAVEAYRSALSAPGDPKVRVNALYDLGNVYVRLRRYDEAFLRYDEALAQAPDDVRVLVAKGNALVALGRPLDAAELFRGAAELAPEDAAIYYNLGNALEAAGRLEEAVAQFEKALAVPGKAEVHADANYNLANALVRMGRAEEALPRYDAALASDPGDVRSVVNKGNTLAVLGRHAEALALFERAATLAPDNPEHALNRGNSLVALGRYEEARAAYLDAVRLNPSSFVAHRNLAAVYQRMGRTAEAREEFAKAQALAPSRSRGSGGETPPLGTPPGGGAPSR